MPTFTSPLYFTPEGLYFMVVESKPVVYIMDKIGICEQIVDWFHSTSVMVYCVLLPLGYQYGVHCIVVIHMQ